MATPVVTPSIAAPVAAPAASPAPIATPAPVSTPAPVVETSAPAIVPSVISPTPDAPTAPVTAQPPTAPNPSDFDDARTWVEAQAAYTRDLQQFQKDHPEVKAETQAADKPAEVAAQTAEQPKADDVPDAFALEDEPSVTPQALNDLLMGDDALKAAVAANPKVRNALHKLARENAELTQFKGMFPNKQSAEFAKKTADRTVGLRMQFQKADTPERMATAFDSFMQEFAVVGPDGKQVIDAQGQPVYGDDFYGLTEHVIRRYADNTLPEVEARLKANAYTNSADRTRDEDLQTALQIVKEDLSGNYGTSTGKPDLSGLPDDIRADFERRTKELEEREAIANGKRTETQKAEHAKKVAEANKTYMGDISQRTFDSIQEVVKDLRSRGAVLPDWQLLAAAPGSKTPIFYQNVANEIEKVIKADPYTVQMMTELEMRPPTPENVKARVEYFDRILKDNIRPIIKTMVRGFATQQSASGDNPTPPNTASIEPRSQAAPKPQILTRDQAYASARSELAKSVRGWDDETPEQQLAMVMTLANRKLTQR